MKKYFGYTRVSTAKQGEGVSLTEQREAIGRHAQRNALEIAQWFEEKETAAKRGRPVFSRMLRLLRQGKANGVVIHKIDRSARNLKDWADLGELIDQGIEVHFANESLDLHSRGGRLSADIQAVVAADYIRNLKEETRKGFYGRLKQGIYPLPAPLGYLDKGKGQPKEIDPVKGPLVRKAFQLYATGTHTLETLLEELLRLGLRNRNGGKVTRNGLSTILNNPFYIGIVRLRRTGETFPGAHQPLVSKALFDRVQARLSGKTRSQGYVREFLFRRLLRCAHCGYSLIGERQKGHVYYRCHSKDCPTTGIREEAVEETVLRALLPLCFTKKELAYLRQRVDALRETWHVEKEQHSQALSLKLGKLGDLLNRLTDAYLDGTIERELFEQRKTALLMERRDVEDKLVELGRNGSSLPDRLSEYLELAGSAWLTYKSGLPEEKRDLLDTVTSNRDVSGKNVAVKLKTPFDEIAQRSQNTNGDPYRDIPRTLDSLLHKIWEWLKHNPAAVDTDSFTWRPQSPGASANDEELAA